MSFISGKGLSTTQLLNLVVNSLYDQFVEKDIMEFDGFKVGILDTFNTINMALPGKHYVAPSYKDVKDLFEEWKETNKEDKRKKFTDFIHEKVNLNKADESMLITAIVAPPAAMMAKKTGQIVPQLALMNAIPDVVFVPAATLLALIAIKIIRLTFIGKTTPKVTDSSHVQPTPKLQLPTAIEEPQIPTEQKTQIPTEQNPQIPIEQNPQILIEQKSHIPTEQNPQIPTEQKAQIPTEQNPQIPTEQKTQIPIEQNPQIPTEQKPQIPTEQKTQIPIEQNPQIPTEQKTQIPTEQNPQIPTEQKTQIPTEQNPQIPTEQNPQILIEQKAQIPIEQNPQIPTEQKTQIPIEQNPKIPTEQKPQISTEQKIQTTPSFDINEELLDLPRHNHKDGTICQLCLETIAKLKEERSNAMAQKT